MGVNELIIPARALLICVSANGNRIEGIAFPKNPVAARNFQFFLSIVLKYFMINGNIKRKATKILRAPIWKGVYTNKARFIKINELPQIMASRVISKYD